MKRLTLLMTVAGFSALCAVGCDCPKKLEYAQQENQELAMRVADLQYQLEQADAIISTTNTDTQAPAGESEYLVVEGDSLWSIAKKQLGGGARYKEILALNPHINKDEPLAIGTKLNLPPK